jgi:hypothetical protein
MVAACVEKRFVQGRGGVLAEVIGSEEELP